MGERGTAVKESEYVQRAEVLKVRLYRTAPGSGRERAALDAVDEAVYKGLLACGKLREPAYFDTWLTRILINVCNSELRRRKREQTIEELPETAAEAFDALPLREAVERLPRELRAVMHCATLRDIRWRRQPGRWSFRSGRYPPGSGGPWSCCGWN